MGGGGLCVHPWWARFVRKLLTWIQVRRRVGDSSLGGPHHISPVGVPEISASWGCPFQPLRGDRGSRFSPLGVPPLGEIEERGLGGWPPTTGPRGGPSAYASALRGTRGPSSIAGQAWCARVSRMGAGVGASGLDSSGPADRASVVRTRAILRRSLPGTTLHPPPRADGPPGCGRAHNPSPGTCPRSHQPRPKFSPREGWPAPLSPLGCPLWGIKAQDSAPWGCPLRGRLRNGGPAPDHGPARGGRARGRRRRGAGVRRSGVRKSSPWGPGAGFIQVRRGPGPRPGPRRPAEKRPAPVSRAPAARAAAASA